MGEALRRSSRVGGATMLAALALVASMPQPPRAPAPRSVILITIDTFRADHIGAYGYPRDTTPNIDRFASRATRFDRAFSQRGLTLPAVSSLMTGQYPYRHGVVGMYKVRLPAAAITLAERLKAAGFRTAAFVSHLGISRETGLDQGFGEYRLFHSDFEGTMARDAARWLRKHRGERVFLWYHSFGAHSPYQAPEPWRHRYTDPAYAGPYTGDQKQMYEIARHKRFSDADRAHLVALYDAKVRWIDHHLGRLLRAIETSGLSERALVVLSADHGEELFDHFLYFSHEASAHDGVLHIPLLVHTPGQRGPRTVGSVVQQVSIAPTILDELGLPPTPGMQGTSFRAALRGGMITPGFAFGTVDQDKTGVAIHTVRTDRWRYVRNPRSFRPGWNIVYPREGLYDLDRDAGATRNVIAQHPEVGLDLRARLDGWAAENPRQRATARTSPEAARRLRALGYVEDSAERGATSGAPGS